MFKTCLNLFDKLYLQNEEKIIDGFKVGGNYIAYIATIHNDGKITMSERILNLKNSEYLGVHKKYLTYLSYYSGWINRNKTFFANAVSSTSHLYALNIALGKDTEKIIKAYEECNKELKKEDALIMNYYQNTVGYKTNEIDIRLIKEHVVAEIIPLLNDVALEIEDDKSEIYKLSDLRIKIFYVLEDEEKTKEIYKKEHERYLYLKSFNKNETAYIRDDGKIYGVPDFVNTVGDERKPTILNNSRNSETDKHAKYSFECSIEDSIKYSKLKSFIDQEFAKGNRNIYFKISDKEIILEPNSYNEDGPKRILGDVLKDTIWWHIEQQGKIGNMITDVQYIGGHSFNIKPISIKKTIFNENLFKNFEDKYNIYQQKCTLRDIEDLINVVYFKNILKYHYFTTDATMIRVKSEYIWIRDYIMKCKKGLYDWFYLNRTNYIEYFLSVQVDKIILEEFKFVSTHTDKGYFSLYHMLNVKETLSQYYLKNQKGEKTMQEIKNAVKNYILSEEPEIEIKNDSEFLFMVGQIAHYLLDKSEAKDKSEDAINRLLMCKPSKIKNNLRRLYKQYNYKIDMNLATRFNKVYSAVCLYEPQLKKTNEDLIIAGYINNNYFYTKTNKGEEENEQ